MEQDELSYKRGFRVGLINGVIIGIAVFLIVIIGRDIWLNGTQTTTIGSGKETGSGVQKEIGKELDNIGEKIQTISQYLDKYYYKDVDEELLKEGIYYGMATALGDRYTTYYTKEQYKELLESDEGSYCGIGVLVSQDTKTGQVVVTKVFSKSSAKEAGVQEGDIFKTVDGKDVSSVKEMDEVADRVRGKEGTKVEITFIRDGKEVELTIPRKSVEVDTVEYEMKENDIGYIQIIEFDGVTSSQLRNAVEELKSQGMKKLIVDLRDNPGGRLDSVRNIASAFVDGDDLFLYSEEKDGTRENYYLEDNAICTEIPMVILVNENSASASEAFTGAMKCYNRATVVGTTTFGKGIMQSLFKLSDGSALKITIGKYYLPDGNNIHEVGITPDVEVKNTDDNKDAQLEKAMEVAAGLK